MVLIAKASNSSEFHSTWLNLTTNIAKTVGLGIFYVFCSPGTQTICKYISFFPEDPKEIVHNTSDLAEDLICICVIRTM